MFKHEWTAGIIDGEGYVGIEKNRAMIRVDNTDFRIVEKLGDLWGGSVFEYHRPDRPHHKRIWRWAITGKKARDFVATIEPFLISRGERARAIISLYELKERTRT